MKNKKRKGKKGDGQKLRAAQSSAGIRTAVALGLVFLALTATAYFAPDLFVTLDTAARDAFAPLQTYAWVQFFLVLTAFGGGVGVIVTALAFATVTRIEPAQIIRLAAVLAFVAFACRVVKAVTERARPEAVVWLEPLSAYSFPSGHASSAGALFGFIALYVYRRTGRLAFAAVPLVIALLVGVSRIVLGAHHASDIIGGFVLAGAVLAAGSAFPFEKLLKKYGGI